MEQIAPEVSAMETQSIRLTHAGRIDKVLAMALEQSRNQVEQLIRNGWVEVDGIPVRKPSHKVAIGTEVRYRLPQIDRRTTPLAVDFDVPILYEDEDLLVIDKPAGLVVHPAPSVKEPTLVDWLIDRGVALSTLSGEERHGIVHRIDKGTTGTLAVAKHDAAHRNLSRQLQDRSMGRYYLALIDLPLKADTTVDAPIARHPKNRLKMATIEGGRAARTHLVSLAGRTGGPGVVAAKLDTGRTHQIRVHLGSLGRHILGDALYGFKSKQGKIPRIYLHAYLLYLRHPTHGERLEVAAPLHADMTACLKHHFNKETLDEILQPAYVRRRLDEFVCR